MILELNTDNQAKEILEGQRRYREMLASQYTAGYTDAEEKLASTIAEKDAVIAEKDAALADKDAAIAQQASEIEALKQQLEALKKSN